MVDNVSLYTVFTDASVDTTTKQYGYGVWVKRDGKARTSSGNGRFDEILFLQEGHAVIWAELYAMAQGLAFIRDDLIGIKGIVLQSDCTAALAIINRLPFCNIAQASKNVVMKCSLSGQPYDNVLDIVREVIPPYIPIWLKWVKGHRHGNRRNYVNNITDKLSRNYRK